MNQIAHVTKELSSYYAEDEPFPNCVFLFGQKSVGKTLCLQTFLESQKDEISSVVIHANECYANQILFETIINALNNHKLSAENNYAPFAKVETVEDFVLELSLMEPDKSYLIAIENAEKLRDMEVNILPVFMKLQEFTGLNISCIFVSHIAFEKFGAPEIVKIHVPDYTKTDLTDIFLSKYREVQIKMKKIIERNQALSEDAKSQRLATVETLDEDFYKNYLNVFLGVFYKACRDFNELEFLANKCYPAYYAPVMNGELKLDDVQNLWRNINKVLKVALKTSHMRIENLTASDMNQKMIEESIIEPVKENSNRGFAQTLELPYYAKFLLIASFLASHNDAKFDKRLFMKHHGKERKRLKQAKVVEKMNVQFGPKSFPIDRLLAIFYAIVDEKVGLTCNLLSQISTLVDLNFLTMSGENNIMEGTARLQSTIGLDFAINIGKVVGFNVKQYLTDFH